MDPEYPSGSNGDPGEGSSSGRMSLNVHLTVPQTTTTADGSHTPNTPEILNSIVSMQQSGPFTSFSQGASYTQSAIMEPQTPAMSDLPVSVPFSTTEMRSPLASTPGSGLLSPTSPSESGSSPASTPSSAMSVQHYRSQFIKEGLKMKVKARVRVDSNESVTTPIGSDTPGISGEVPKVKVESSEELTEEDELRRKRRRERNKIAATKCRNKKKMRTQLLVKESETLETQNIYLKSEIIKLEEEKKRLMNILALHQPSCVQKAQGDRGNNDTFRVPPVPASSNAYSSTPSSSGTTSLSASRVQNFQEEPSALYQLDQDVHVEGEGSFFEGFDTNGAGQDQEGDSFHGGPFLAKRHFNPISLDVSSRCIAH